MSGSMVCGVWHMTQSFTSRREPSWADSGSWQFRHVAASRIFDPIEADRLIREGRCDAAGMTRALITDPDLPRKAREGRLTEVLRCLGCNACIAHYHAGTPIACAQNPRTGRERTLAAPARTAETRRIVVVGAGPAGVAAAADAAAGGHEVVLLGDCLLDCGLVH